MLEKPIPLTEPGPFRADQLKSGEPYELSNGHPIVCMPTGGRGSQANLIGGAVLDSDPAVESAGVDTGFSFAPGDLRAPDVAVGNVSDKPGWVQGAPPLAVEYADTGQNEADLKQKIKDLLAAGTRFIWVIRLSGPRRVEVYEVGKKMRLAQPGDLLTAPGVLKNPVPVLSLYDREAAHQVTLSNLLQRQGYDSIDQILDEGEAKGRMAGEKQTLRKVILQLLSTRGIAISDDFRTALAKNENPTQLSQWFDRASVVASSDEILLA